MYRNPYERLMTTHGNWLKANFHTHAGTQADPLDIGAVIEAYRQDGYGALTISNQYVLTDTAKWSQSAGITLINGFELRHERDHDLLFIGVDEYFTGSHQELIDQCVALGGIAVVCHPNYSAKHWWPMEEMLGLTGYTGVEIFNGVIFKATGSGLATDVWDILLSHGKLVWGFANDDFHQYANLGRAWNMIYSASGSSEDIKSALQEGCFYTSTGLTMDHFMLEDGTIGIGIDTSRTYVKDYQYLFIGKDGVILDNQTGEKGSYRVNGDETYVRVQAISEHGAMLWTQPVFCDSMKRP